MLDDMLQDQLILVVCGTAVGNTSAFTKHYYANRGNKFWQTLFEVGLTTERLAPAEYKRLIEYRIGLTDLVKAQAGMDRTLSKDNFGIGQLQDKIRKYQPKVLCFNGKRAAEKFLMRPVEYGLQAERIGITKIFIAPSTSGAAAKWWDRTLWKELADLCEMEKG